MIVRSMQQLLSFDRVIRDGDKDDRIESLEGICMTKMNMLEIVDNDEGTPWETAVRVVERCVNTSDSLQILSLRYCSLQDAHCAKVLNSIRGIQDRIRLDFSGNEFGSEACKSLIELINRSDDDVELEQLHLRECKLSDDVLDALVDQGVLHKIRSLDIGCNSQITATALEHTLRAMQGQASKSLFALALSSLHGALTVPVYRTLFSNRNSITALDLWNNKLNDSMFILLNNFVGNSSQIRRLNLKNCNVGDRRVETIFHTLMNVGSIETLDLGENGITDDGVNKMINCTTNHSGNICGLSVINLRGNEVSMAGVIAMARCIKVCD